ncbi:MAG: hypothetical protein VCD00_09320 [Candidatus Hydrogenedentota bacterium]
MGIAAKHIIVALVISFTCTSCVTVAFSLMGYSVRKIDVTEDTQYHHFYKMGQVYRLRTDCYLEIQTDAPQLKKSLELIPGTLPEDFDWKNAYNVQKWYLNLLEDKPQPKGQVVKDTGFTIVEFTMLKYNLGGDKGWIVDPVGKILDGPYSEIEFYLGNNFISEIVLLNDERDIAYRPRSAIELVDQGIDHERSHSLTWKIETEDGNNR